MVGADDDVCLDCGLDGDSVDYCLCFTEGKVLGLVKGRSLELLESTIDGEGIRRYVRYGHILIPGGR